LQVKRLGLANKLFFPLMLVAGLVVGYGAILQRLINSWGSGDNSYGYLIIPLFVHPASPGRGSRLHGNPDFCRDKD